MRTSLSSAVLALVAPAVVVSALPQIKSTPLAPALPPSAFEAKKHKMFTLDEARDFVAKGNLTAIIPDIISKPANMLASFLGSDNQQEEEQPQKQAEKVQTSSVHSSSAKTSKVQSNQVQSNQVQTTATKAQTNNRVTAAATCSNPRVRYEWDIASKETRQAFVDGIKCLLNKPASGNWPQAKNRYEDLVAVHQTLTDNVHQNAKFLLWHRYFYWTFEDILRTECGFNNDMIWFDETKYAGRFADSSIFSDQWLGGIKASGNCITNGQFANLALNVGPVLTNQYHCLARDDNPNDTANTNQAMVDMCNSANDYATMATCAEGGAHAWGHNGVGSVMKDVYGSPGDPVFWLHHGFVDRNYRIWQNADGNRVQYINGVDHAGNALTMDTNVDVGGLRATVKIRDIINTMDGKLCYKYNY